MASLQSNYITKNGSASWSDCNLAPNDNLNIECVVSFSLTELTSSSGKQYKAEFKFVGPGTPSSGYSVFSGLINVSNTYQTFTSPTFPIPLPLGTYTILWITIYDQYGFTIVAGKV